MSQHLGHFERYIMRQIGIHFIGITLVCMMLIGCQRQSRYSFAEGTVWNTLYHITYSGPSELGDSIRPILDRIGKSVSVFDQESLVSRLNVSDSCMTDEALRRIYLLSVKVNSESDGMFDPTLSPLITAWGFGKGHRATSDTLRLDSLLALTGIGKTYFRSGFICKPNRNMQFNFSAVAKGYGCDAVGEWLVSKGVTDYLVEIGGEIACKGRNPKGYPWAISIDKPVTDPKGNRHISQLKIFVTDCGIATSGNYRNYHEKKGVRYGHTISPRTGRPVQTDILSATVIAPTAMEADAYATACMAMGSLNAKKMINRLGLKVMLIMDDSSVWESDGFIRYIERQ